MRHLFETAARVLRDRREMAVAVATAIVAVILIGGGQGDLAAVVALGAAGFMAGRACRYRLAAQEWRRQAEYHQRRGARTSIYKEKARAYRRHLLAVFRESRKHLDSLKGDACQRGCWYAPHLEGALERAEKRLAQAAPAELLTPEEVDALYASDRHVEKEVNTTDTAAEE